MRQSSAANNARKRGILGASRQSTGRGVGEYRLLSAAEAVAARRRRRPASSLKIIGAAKIKHQHIRAAAAHRVEREIAGAQQPLRQYR